MEGVNLSWEYTHQIMIFEFQINFSEKVNFQTLKP